MPRRIQHVAHGAAFHHLAVFQHQHLVRHGADDVDVVGDEQVGQAALFLQALQQGQHLLLDGDVEGAGGFVQHQQFGFDDERPRQGDALLTLASTDGKFTASVPLDDILDALLVYELDGKPLPEQYGGPIRFLIPDAAACHTGGADTCANVKFLGRIELTRGKVEDSRDKMDETPHG